MNIFQVVKSVLDEQYAAIPGTEEQKDDAIRKALRYLGECYARLNTDECEIDYADPVTRFAYIYRYVTAHADYVCQLLASTRLGNKLFFKEEEDEEEKKVSITCIGGGPGSDLVGVLKFIERNRMEPALRFMLLDREQLWNDAWCDVDTKLNNALKTSVNFLQFDVTNPKSWAGHQKYLNSDLFTLIYFVSETYAFRKEAADFYMNLFKNAKTGARFLFIDNDASCFSGWFDELCEKAGLTVVEKGEGRMTTDFGEEKKDLGEYYAKFGDPKLQAKVAYRYLKKK
jgi:hypothetical protein